MPSRTVRSTCTERGSAATCSLKRAIGGFAARARGRGQGVVGDDQPASDETRQHRLVVVDVAVLVGVDEDEVELAFEPLDRLERRAEVQR